MCQRRHRTIYQRIAELCTHCTLGAPWQRLNVDDDCRRLPQDAAEMLARIREGFSEQDLLAAAVVRRGEDGELLLAETLANPNAEIILLREQPYDPPFDIVAPNGLLSGRELPIFAACRDHRTRVALRELDGVLLAVLSMRAYVLFRSMGLPVALAAGLDDLDHGRLSSMEQMLRSNSIPAVGTEQSAELSEDIAQGDDSSTPSDQSAQMDTDAFRASSLMCVVPTEIESQLCTNSVGDGENQAAEETVLPRAVILVAWEAATLEIRLPPGVVPVAQFLASAERYLGIDFSAFGVWSPSERDLEALQFCIRHGNDEQIRAAVLQSIEQSTFELFHVLDGHVGPRPIAEGYATAQAELRRCLDARTDDAARDERLARAIAQHQSLVERDLVLPLVDQAIIVPDALLRNMTITAANVFRTIHRHAPYVDVYHTDERAGYKDLTGTQLNYINAIVKLVREIRRD